MVAVLQRPFEPQSQCAACAVKRLNENVGPGGESCPGVIFVDDVAVFEVLIIHVKRFKGVSFLAEGNAGAREDARHFLKAVFLRFRGFKVGDRKDRG